MVALFPFLSLAHKVSVLRAAKAVSVVAIAVVTAVVVARVATAAADTNPAQRT